MSSPQNDASDARIIPVIPDAPDPAPSQPGGGRAPITPDPLNNLSSSQRLQTFEISIPRFRSTPRAVLITNSVVQESSSRFMTSLPRDPCSPDPSRSAESTCAGGSRREDVLSMCLEPASTKDRMSEPPTQLGSIEGPADLRPRYTDRTMASIGPSALIAQIDAASPQPQLVRSRRGFADGSAVCAPSILDNAFRAASIPVPSRWLCTRSCTPSRSRGGDLRTGSTRSI